MAKAERLYFYYYYSVCLGSEPGEWLAGWLAGWRDPSPFKGRAVCCCSVWIRLDMLCMQEVSGTDQVAADGKGSFRCSSISLFHFQDFVLSLLETITFGLQRQLLQKPMLARLLLGAAGEQHCVVGNHSEQPRNRVLLSCFTKPARSLQFQPLTNNLWIANCGQQM